tara:strand:- start:2643 stop:3461 length:819 start_codon:yes stop_codon:yes gene_type:complete
MRNIIIKKINLDDILKDKRDNTRKYNNNNNYDTIPSDYEYYVEKFDTKHWIDKMHKYKKINIQQKDIKWLFEMLKLSNITGKVTKLYDDEINSLVSELGDIDGSYFVKTDKTSLRNGIYGVGPYTNLEDIIISMCTTQFGHHAFTEKDHEINLYLMEFEKINMDLEFRVFVVDNTITCVSQQNIYVKNKIINDTNSKELINKLDEYFNINIKNKLSNFKNYIMDIAYIDNNYKFIEINPFGKEYTSGSACFDWICDEKTIYDKSFIEFRYVI